MAFALPSPLVLGATAARAATKVRLPFACAEASISSARSRPSSSRRSFISYLAAVPVAAALIPCGALAGIQVVASDGGLADPEEEIDLQKKAGPSVDMLSFRQLLDSGKVSRVWFFGVTNEKCYFESDGNIALIGEGYPVEMPSSPQSPLWVMAQVRDHNVPYTMSPISPRFLRKKATS